MLRFKPHYQIGLLCVSYLPNNELVLKKNGKSHTFLDTFEAAGATKAAVDTFLEACLVDDGKDGGGFGTGAKDLLLVAGILYLYFVRRA